VSDLEELENAHIRKVLDEHGGDVREAAKALGISRATLYRKLKKLR
jgi:transcriptional regulator of acetoin/glycerol metabolism